MEVETKHADLATMAVTINALHVNGKRMTLSVFRQLPQGEEVEGDPLWGIVRYPIKDEGDIWLVFSHGGILYRRALTLHMPSEIRRTIESLKNQKVAYQQRADHAVRCANAIEKARVETTYPHSFLSEIFNHKWLFDNETRIRAILKSSKRPHYIGYGTPDEPWIAEDRDRRPDELTEEEAGFVEYLRNIREMLKDKFIEADSEYTQFTQQQSDWIEREKRLLDELPQLFIAV